VTGSSDRPLVEINARLGGDRIPQLGQLALGVDAPVAAADAACGRRPDLTASRRRAAAVRFLYPGENGIARAVHIDADRLPSTVDSAEAVAIPGQELALPPAGHVSSRYALLIAAADTAQACLADLDAADAVVRVELIQPRSAR